MDTSANTIHLIKFDIKTGTNNYYSYQHLVEDGMIIETSGRVGVDSFQDVYEGGIKKLNQLIKAKMDKGYKDLKVEEIKNCYTQTTYHYSTEKCSGLLIFDRDTVENFIQQIINIPKQTVKLSIFLDDYPIKNNYKTPLGLIPKLVILKAYSILGKIEDLVKEYLKSNQTMDCLKRILINKQVKRDIDNALNNEKEEIIREISVIAEKLQDLINDYFNLIPTKIQADEVFDMLLDSGLFKLGQEKICNLMLSYYSEIEMFKSSRILNVTDNDIKIEKVIDIESLENISNLYTLNGGYEANTRVKNVFKIQSEKHNKRFIQKSNVIGNVQQVWHGTNKINTASVITRGLLLPVNLTGHERSGSFGSGIYFSSASKKSFRFYKDNYSRETRSTNIVLLILASVAAGAVCVPNDQHHYPPVGFDSVWANRGNGSHEDELVVYSEDQVRVDYIVEIEKNLI